MDLLQLEATQHELGQRLRSGRAAESTARTLVGELAAGLLLRAGYRGCIHGMTVQASEAAFQQAERDHGDQGADLRRVARDVLQIIGAPHEAATGQRIAAAFSSATGSAALQAVFSTQFMQALTASADTTSGWTAERTITDLREQRRLRLGMPGTMERLPPGQTAQHTTLDVKGGETYTPARFGRQVVVDEQNLVENDLRPILDSATLLGRAAGSLRSDLVYAVVLANAALADGVALFHSDHGNLGTSAALASDKLDAGLAAMAKQVENSQPVNAQASFLLVPPELFGLAGRLARDMAAPGMKPLAVRSEPRLSLGVVSPATGDVLSGSATSWYLAAPAENAPSVEFAARTPQPEVTLSVLSRGEFGLSWSCCWDVAAAALSPYGLRKHTA